MIIMGRLFGLIGSIKHYNQNADHYYNNTLNVDMSKIYHSFMQHLSPGGLILDAGYGSGRGSPYFLKEGYHVRTFDVSNKWLNAAPA